MSLSALIDTPFELLLEFERLAKAGMSRQQGAETADDAWTGIAFRLGNESYVAARADVREVLPLPEQLTRVPTQFDRHTRVLHIAARGMPSAVIVNEVFGFRRFSQDSHTEATENRELRCERYLAGQYSSGGDRWPVFNFTALVDDEQFQDAGDRGAA